MRRPRLAPVTASLACVLMAITLGPKAAWSESKTPLFHGVIVPMVTPFDQSGDQIDVPALVLQTRWLLEKPVDMLFAVSGLGQWRRLSFLEKQQVIHTVLQEARGRKPVVAGITSVNSLEETVALGKWAASEGVDALAYALPERLTPTSPLPTQAELAAAVRTVHDQTNLPLMIYDAQAALLPQTVRSLLDLKRFAAIKYRTKDIERFLRMVHASQGKVAVLSGVEHMGVAALAAGAVGIVGGGANVFPQMIQRIFERFQAGDLVGSRRATMAVIAANDGIPGSQELKYTLAHYYGIPMTDVPHHLPYEPLSLADRDEVDFAIRRADPSLRSAPTPAMQVAAKGEEKRRRYLELTKAVHDKDGFVHNKCDGVTFTAISCIARGLSQTACPAYLAEDSQKPGLWYRHAQHDCFQGDGTAGGSRSDNSPDVFLALALMFWHYHDLKSVQNIIAYGETHDWEMGRSRKGIEAETTLWSADLRALYYELRFRLGGEDSPKRQLLSRQPTFGEGFQVNVAANRLLVIALMTDDLKPEEWAALKVASTRAPHNAVIQALHARVGSGSEPAAWQLLLDPKHFPPDQLPNNHAQHCEEYLYQRDEMDGGAINTAWLPCANEPLSTHSGTDLLWSACILTPGCLRSVATVPLAAEL